MSRRGDWLSALAWAAFGALLLAASWRMERLESQGAPAWSAPGLTPGVVGALMMIFALALAWQSRPARQRDARVAAQAQAETGTVSEATTGSAAESAAPAQVRVTDNSAADDSGPGSDARRTLLAAGLCLVFAGASLGRGLPFRVEAAAFIVVFISVFSWREWRAEARVARGLAQSLLIAVVAALAIAWLFESLFLVRLP